MNGMFTKLSKQHKTGKFIGASLDTYMRASTFFNFAQMFMIATTFYVVTIEPRFPINFVFFITTGLFIASIILIFVYKFITPSGFAYDNWQWWEHENPLRVKLEEHDKILRAIQERLDANGTGTVSGLDKRVSGG